MMMRFSALTVIMVFAIACSSSKTTSKTDLGNPDTGTLQDTGMDIPPEIGGDVHVNDPGQTITDLGQTDKGNIIDTGADVGKSCPSEAITGDTCAKVGACLLACDEATYQAQCKAGSQTGAVDDFSALIDCAAKAGCDTVFNGERFTKCVLDNCDTEYKKCFVSDGKCQDIRNCRKDCVAGDPTCPVKCIADGSADAQADYFKYVECLFSVDCVKVLGQIMPNGWPTTDCENNARMTCGNFWQSCMNIH